MAKMIPERLSKETKSTAEKRLFQLFQGMVGTESWTIIHSLAIAKHITQSQGEADFVVIIPETGVFVLEVKGGLISQKNGQWISKDRYDVDNIIKNPIEEANNAMHSIKDFINSAPAWEIGRPIFGFGIIFPDTSFHNQIKTVEIADEQIADYEDCISSDSIKNYLLRLAKYWQKRFRDANSSLPNSEQWKKILQLLKPTFEGKASLQAIIHNVENQMVELTENQQDTFETITENERCIVRGYAGTGKTIIALNYARQLARDGKKVGFFCYNKQFANFIKKNTNGEKGLICDSFTEYMDAYVAEAQMKPLLTPDKESYNYYYNKQLPQLFAELLIDSHSLNLDVLILDEAQDLVTSEYMDVFDLMLSGGLKEGSWFFFMDAEKQNIFRTGISEDDIFKMLKDRKINYTKCLLKDNCRNSVAIIEKTDAIFGTKTRHKNYTERGKNVEIKTYRKGFKQVEILENILNILKEEGVEKKDIVILSPVKYQNSVVHQINTGTITTDPNRDNYIFFSTIQGYKGLESSVVILTDIDFSAINKDKMNLLYVGMTRAKSVLYIIAQEETAKRLGG